MKKFVRLFFIFLLVLFIGIQFVRPEKNMGDRESPNEISRIYPTPDSVKVILEKACYDCHSNSTVYPWYSNIQPVYFWLNDHIVDGKRHLNFSEFRSYTLLKQAKKLKKTASEIDEDDMPLESYTWIHKNAILSPAEKEMVNNWAKKLSVELYAKVSPDEIEKDRLLHDQKKRLKEK